MGAGASASASGTANRTGERRSEAGVVVGGPPSPAHNYSSSLSGTGGLQSAARQPGQRAESRGSCPESVSLETDTRSGGSPARLSDGDSLDDDTSDERSVGAAVGMLTGLQERRLRCCLDSLETCLDVLFRVDSILPHVRAVTCSNSSSEPILTQGTSARGIYVIDDGSLEVLLPNDDVILNRLLPGDYAGELSTLFRVSCTAIVRPEQRSVLLCMPAEIVQENVQGRLDKEKMLKWCTKKSYVDGLNIFGPGVLAHRITVSCMKASFLSKCCNEAIEYLATLTTPMLFSAEDVLIAQGEESCHIFFVLRGVVECLGSEHTWSSKTIKFSDEGHTIGEDGFLLQGKSSWTATAKSPLLVAPVTMEMILEMTNKFPSEASKLKILLQKYRKS